MQDRIVILAVDSIATRAIVNAVRLRFDNVTVVLEDKEPIALFLRRRIRRLGPIIVFGQLAFILFSRIARVFYIRKERDFFVQAGLNVSSILSLIHI